QMQAWQARMGVREGHEWDPMEAVPDPAAFRAFLDDVSFFAATSRRLDDVVVPVGDISLPAGSTMSTQAGFGKILDMIAKSDTDLAARIMTTSPDVSGTTSLGPWINRRKLFAREARPDLFRAQNIPSTAKWEFAADGQHIELGIAEMNLCLVLAAAGLSHRLFGKRLLPVGTVYDPFVCRGLDALNYACYQDARFMIVGTPSGVTLAPEGGAHQSIGTPLIGMSQDGLAAFEPAFVDELAVIMGWAFDYMQRDGDSAGAEHSTGWLRDATGGSVYLRLTTKPLDQPGRRMTPGLAADIIKGGYWLRPPGPNCELVIAYQGVMADEAIAAAGMLGEQRRDIGVLAITSADRLNAGWTAAHKQQASGNATAQSHIETLLAPVHRDATLISVIDGHPATLSWLGGVYGHRLISHGVEHFGQTGSIDDLYRHFGIDRHALVTSALQHTPPRRRQV
ncbi:MAG: transketolase, partial [Alphaproteobacteria bacterium]|nr:transketolase [Alphaproteobacteria bacterium]